MAGGQLEYLVQVTNVSTVAATNVVITDDLDLPVASPLDGEESERKEARGDDDGGPSGGGAAAPTSKRRSRQSLRLGLRPVLAAPASTESQWLPT